MSVLERVEAARSQVQKESRRVKRRDKRFQERMARQEQELIERRLEAVCELMDRSNLPRYFKELEEHLMNQGFDVTFKRGGSMNRLEDGSGYDGATEMISLSWRKKEEDWEKGKHISATIRTGLFSEILVKGGSAGSFISISLESLEDKDLIETAVARAFVAPNRGFDQDSLDY